MSLSAPPALPATVSKQDSLLHRAFVARELGIVVALVALLAVTTAKNSRFLETQSIQDLLLGASILVILAIGQTCVVITKNVDLSVGSVLGLVAFAVGKFFVTWPHANLLVALVIGLGMGLACGVVNGALIAVAKVPALVITLGTLYVFRGLDYSWASGQQINAADMPASFLRLGTRTLLGVPVLAIVAVVVLVAAGIVLRSYRSGRELYAIGSDATAARLSGIPVSRRVFAAFAVSGALAGLAGVMYAARFGTIDASAGNGIELQVVAAAVVGGVAIVGGSGSVWGAALGALLLTTIGSSLSVLQITPFWQQAINGALILAAIGLDRLLALRLASSLRGGRPHGA
ncbi:monosaccharide ABC transporter membrane protein (CUT2 family) [Motilibacter rhizosphaerae]|uniref:Autoinducer 2 import system permease protein LsrC n=2 Tax=Motilibacter rhizosphaerae TaxID=598652 RepID=A0A4Q7NXD9_9ACTN|nr:monosaccharide ABC transporter membrane protein (CUT2 family) [Motilibacter rhizosphaerae]